MYRPGGLVARVTIQFTILLLVLGTGRAQATGTVEGWIWHQEHPYSNYRHYESVAYGNGRFVAVGNNGVITLSTDGQTWTDQDAGTAKHFYSVAFGNGLFVATTTDGALFTSQDGKAWMQQSIQMEEYPRVLFGAGLFASRSGGSLVVSSDGLKWERSKQLPPYEQCTVAATTTTILLQCDSATFLSDDGGRQWQAHAPTGMTFPPTRIVHNGREWIGHNSGEVYSSADGVQWRLRYDYRPNFDAWSLVDITFANGLLVMVGTQATMLTSRDQGYTWTQHSFATEDAMNAVTFGDGQFVAVGTYGRIFQSTDGDNWVQRSPGATYEQLHAVTYGNGIFMATGDGNAIMISRDGTRWVPSPLPHAFRSDPSGISPPDTLYSVAYGNGRFVTLAHSGHIASTTDGLSWTVINTKGAWFGVEFLNDRFVALGNRHTAVSFDGLKWDITEYDRPYGLKDAAYGNGRYVAVGSWMIMTSTDGITWREERRLRDFGPWNDKWDDSLKDIVYAGGRFVAVGGAGGSTQRGSSVVYQSEDGGTWERTVIGSIEVPFQSIVAAGDLLVTTIDAPTIGLNDYFTTGLQTPFFASEDGTNWRPFYQTEGLQANRGTWAQGKLLYVGVGGAVLAAMRPCPSFTDVAGDSELCRLLPSLLEKKVVGGYPDGAFRPGALVSRAELSKMLVTAMGLSPQQGLLTEFSDTTGHWAADQGYLSVAARRQWMQGYPDGTFRPDAPVSRAELAKILATIYGVGQGTGIPYSDLEASQWFTPFVAAAVQSHLFGQAAPAPLWMDTTFLPYLGVTREEAVLALANLTARPSAR